MMRSACRTCSASAAHALRAINPYVAVESRAERVTPEAGAAALEGVDLVLDGTDTFAARQAINAACVSLGVPLISGAIAQWEGQVSIFHPATGTPCYACLFPEPPAPGQAPSCAEAGVMGALAGIIGSIMAAEAIKWITGAGAPLTGQLLIYDALWGESRKIAVSRRAGCPVCGAA